MSMLFMARRLFSTITLAFVLFWGCCVQSLAQSHIARSIERGMLSQRMAMAACLVMAEVLPETNSALALLSAEQYSEQLGADPDSARTLSKQWSTFGPAVKQIASGDYHNIVVRQFLTLNRPLLQAEKDILQTQVAVSLSNGDMTAQTRATAGQLLIISQSLALQSCLIAADIDSDLARGWLDDAIKSFESALLFLETALEAEDAPDLTVEDTLWVLRGEWDTLAEDLAATVQGASISNDDLSVLTTTLGQLLLVCEDLSAAYAQT